MPLSARRSRERGYNQVTLIVKEALKAKSGNTLSEDLLMRKRHTEPQTTISHKKRLTNLTGAFEVKVGSVIKDAHILLIDDVTTTGATMRAAKAALLPHGPASVTAIALAH